MVSIVAVNHQIEYIRKYIAEKVYFLPRKNIYSAFHIN